ncbi:MAG: DUF348 domain-containing protein [Firmicutes bacterium]|nr:DUF348 domain-containing protein [Bacillota bacterium]
MKLKIMGLGREQRYKYLYLGLGIGLIAIVTSIISYLIALDQVMLAVDGRSYVWKTVKPTVAKALAEKGVVLKEGDEVNPSLTSSINKDTRIEVIRGFKVEIITNGKNTKFKTIARPVKEVLTKAGIKFDGDDIVKPGLKVVAEPDSKIQIIDVRTEVVTKEVPVNPQTEYQRDQNLERGIRKTIRSGKSGLAEHQIRMTYHDGKLIKQSTLTKRIIKPVVNELIAVGTKPVVRTLVTSRGTYRYVEARVMEATAYYPGPESCGKYADGYTYTGKKAGYGVVAVDPRVIKLGTQLYIEGYGKAEAADIGGAIKGNIIDLCYETYQEAIRFGRKKVKVYILE